MIRAMQKHNTSLTQTATERYKLGVALLALLVNLYHLSIKMMYPSPHRQPLYFHVLGILVAALNMHLKHF